MIHRSVLRWCSSRRYGRYNTCRQLLDTPGFKRILNEPDQTGQTPLHLSCQNGHTRVVQLLLHKGAQFTKSYDGDTPLHDAAAHGHVSTMNTILQAHAHLINSINHLGMTPLHCAAAAGHVECVDLLLSKSAQFLVNIEGETFLDLAIIQKQKDVCLTIIAHDRWEMTLWGFLIYDVSTEACLDGKKRWTWRARSIELHCWVWSNICPIVFRCCSIDASLTVTQIRSIPISMSDHTERGTEIAMCLICFVVDLRFPLYQLDGRGRDRRQRAPVSNAATERESSTWKRIGDGVDLV